MAGFFYFSENTLLLSLLTMYPCRMRVNKLRGPLARAFLFCEQLVVKYFFNNACNL